MSKKVLILTKREIENWFERAIKQTFLILQEYCDRKKNESRLSKDQSVTILIKESQIIEGTGH